jgi:hypothetical protein
MPVPDFSPGEVLTAAAMDSIGLWRVASGTLSGVTTQFVGCFSSDYTNYCIKIDNMNNGSATTRNIAMKFLVGSTPTSANYITNQVIQFGPSVIAGSGTSGSAMDLFGMSSNVNGAGSAEIQVFSPNVTVNTFAFSQSYTYQSNVTAFVHRNASHTHSGATAFNGFEISGVTDALSGNVTIYGYRKP